MVNENIGSSDNITNITGVSDIADNVNQNLDYAIITPQKKEPTLHFVFYAGDLIPDELKFNCPEWRQGGRVVEVQSLQYRNYFIPRCEIVELRAKMEGVLVNNVHPQQRSSGIRVYEVAETTPDGRLIRRQYGTRINPRTNQTEHDGLIRFEILPAGDLNYLTGLNDGIVEMPVKTRAEARLAQEFLFPQWYQQTAELRKIPDLLTLKTYFEEKLQESLTFPNAELRDLFAKVCQKAIQSVVVCYEQVKLIVQNANNNYEKYKMTGGYRYSDLAGFLSAQYNLPRADMLQQQQTLQQNANTEALNRLISALNQLASAPQPVSFPTQPVSSAPYKDTNPTNNDVTDTKSDVDGDDLDVKTIYNTGDVLELDGQNAIVLKRLQFGRLLVRLADGTEKQITFRKNKKSNVDKKLINVAG